MQVKPGVVHKLVRSLGRKPQLDGQPADGGMNEPRPRTTVSADGLLATCPYRYLYRGQERNGGDRDRVEGDTPETVPMLRPPATTPCSVPAEMLWACAP